MGELYKRQNRNLWLGQPATAQNVVPASAGLAPAGRAEAILLDFIEIQNRGGSAAAVALVGLLPDAYWKAAQVSADGTVVTDGTADAQDVDTNDFALETTTQNTGCLLEARVPFGVASFDVTTAGAGGTPTHTAKYWNGAAWTALEAASFLVDIPRTAHWATGEQLMLLDPLTDWAPGGTDPAPQVATNYALWVQMTNTGTTTAALARRVYLGIVLASKDALAANGEYTITPAAGIKVPPYVKGINGAWGAADTGNNIHLVYRFIG